MVKNVLVIGAGRFGAYTSKTLAEIGHEVMIVDSNEDKVSEILPYVTGAEIGDSTNEAFMRSLGIDEYDLCIVAIGDDFTSSLETTSILKDLGAKKIVARATSERQERLLLNCGADDTVYPERQLGSWTAVRYTLDNVLEYINLPDGYAILKVPVPAEWDGRRIGDLSVRSDYGINILGVEKDRMNMAITADIVLDKGADVLVLGLVDVLRRVFHL